MADEGLKIRVGADLSDLNKELKTAQKDMQSFGASVSKGINAGGFDDFTQKVRAIKKPTSEATRSLVDLGRIAQDAPYGFLGIANNINPALESFQRLKLETGSTGKALKSLALGMAGPAGVGVAFSVVSSALIVAVQKYGSLSNALKALTGDLSAATILSNQLNKALAESLGNARGEASNLQTLVRVAKDVSLSTEARKNAIEEINNKYPKYLKNLSLETLNTNATSTAIAKQIQLLELQGKQKSIQSLLDKKFAEQFENDNKDLNDQLGFWDQAALGAKSLLGLNNMVADAVKMGTKNYIEQNKSIEEQIRLLQDEAFKVSGGIAEIQGFTIKEDKVKKIKEKFFKLIGPEIEIPVSFGAKKIFSDSTKEMYDAFKNFKNYFEQKDDLKIEVPLTIDTSKPIIPPEHIQQAITQMQAMQSELDAMALFVGGPLSDTFAGLFRTIATDGKLSMKQVGEAAKQLVTDLIAAAVKAAVLAVIFKAFGGKAGAVGSFGSLFKGLLTGGSKMATGGIVPPGFENDTFPARLSSREAVIPLDRLESMIGGRHEGSGEMVARLRGAGPDLLLYIKRQERSQNRSF